MLGPPHGLGEQRRHCGSAISALCSNSWKLVICVHYKMAFGYPVRNGAPILGQCRKTKSRPSTGGAHPLSPADSVGAEGLCDLGEVA